MGNQLTALAPAQILPLESYFSELPDYGKPIRYVGNILAPPTIHIHLVLGVQGL